jgi:hypothetical protein
MFETEGLDFGSLTMVAQLSVQLWEFYAVLKQASNVGLFDPAKVKDAKMVSVCLSLWARTQHPATIKNGNGNGFPFEDWHLGASLCQFESLAVDSISPGFCR